MNNLFSIKRWLPLLMVLFVVSSCKKNEVDVDALTDFPPGILSISPADGAKAVAGVFDIVVVFADGTISPLASASVTLKDANGTELATASVTLEGTEGSITIPSADFDSPNLALGFYGLSIAVTDANGQTTNRETTFELSNLPFEANFDEMYLAGSYNGWGADAFTLIAANTWELREVMLDGGEWKLKNCVDWCDKDWGDAACSGTVVETTGGGANSACSPSGLFNMTFNDATLSYEFRPSVEFATNIPDLYLLGSFNDFFGEEYNFNLVADHTWVLDEIELAQGDLFKFSDGPAFMGDSWGDNEADGIADLFGSNIEFTDETAFYSVTFNDESLEYTLEFVRFPSIGIIGSATPGGWDEDTDMTDNGDGTYSITINLTDGLAKFRQNDDWAVNWGGSEFPSGIGTQNGPDIPVTAGLYEVTFNRETGAYDFSSNLQVGIIGDATPDGWAGDTEMTNNGDGTYSLLVGLKTGLLKFREVGNWDVNWGAPDFPSGTGVQDGDNIPVQAGIYNISFNAGTGEYNFEEATIGIIGDATPTGWTMDTDLAMEAGNEPWLIVNMTCVDGVAKFRMNDDWPVNWGASDFPSGIGTQDGPDIPVSAGTYDIRFNVNTGEYSFQ
ncbi:MAG: hypothetical protein AAF598_02170 [Bacteroidota bacterium]